MMRAWRRGSMLCLCATLALAAYALLLRAPAMSPIARGTLASRNAAAVAAESKAAKALRVLQLGPAVERVLWQPFPELLPTLWWHHAPVGTDVLSPAPAPARGPTRDRQLEPRVAIVSFAFGADTLHRFGAAYSAMSCYAARHGYPYYIETVDLVRAHPVLSALPNAIADEHDKTHFNKVLVLQKYLPLFDWVLFVDGDVFPLNRSAPLEPWLDHRFALILQRRSSGDIWPNGFWQNTPIAFTMLSLWMSYLTSGWGANGDNGPLIDLMLHLAIPQAYNDPVTGCHAKYLNVSRNYHDRLPGNPPKGPYYREWVLCGNAQMRHRYEHPPFWKSYAAMTGFMRAAEHNGGPCHGTIAPGDVFGHGKGFTRYITAKPYVMCDPNEPDVDPELLTTTRAEWDALKARCRGGVMPDAEFDRRFAQYFPPHPLAANVPLTRPPPSRLVTP